MRTMISRSRATLLSLSVLGALGFGASAALAEAPRLPECRDQSADGVCGTDSGCQSDCNQIYGPGARFGNCNESTYCCYCIEI
jgi:hypothetical protein